MKLLVISPSRIPSKRANSIQTMEICSGFANSFSEVELWVGKSREEFLLEKNETIFDFYNVNNHLFSLRFLYQTDIKFLGRKNEFIWSNIRSIVFSINSCINLIKARKEKIIIYTRVWHFLVLYGFLRKCRLLKFPVFFEAHKFSKNLSKVVKYSDGLVVINSFLKDLYKNSGVENILVAHDGVNISSYKKLNEYRFIENKKFYNVYYTGSFTSDKGVYTLIDSAEYLPKNYLIILIGGDSKSIAKIQKYINTKEFSSSIRIIEYMSKKELINFMSHADVFVLPNSVKYKSNSFTSPMKLFEYMSSKRPIVASDIPAFREILSDDNAYLFESDNPRDCAESIISATKNDSQSRVVNAFTDCEKYNWNLRSKKIKEFIEKNIKR